MDLRETPQPRGYPRQPWLLAAAAGLRSVFTRSARARGAAGRLALELDAAPLTAGRLERSVRRVLGDPDARMLFRNHAGAAWVDSTGAVAAPTPGRSITTFQGTRETAIEHDPVLDRDRGIVAAVGAVAGLALEAEHLRTAVRIRGGDGRSATGNGASALHGVLTPREREVLALVAEGLTDGAIAERLYVTRRTVESHLGHVFEKLELPAGSSQNRRVHAVRRYLEAR